MIIALKGEELYKVRPSYWLYRHSVTQCDSVLLPSGPAGGRGQLPSALSHAGGRRAAGSCYRACGKVWCVLIGIRRARNMSSPPPSFVLKA